ncbi:very-long-chain 3-oxoacyl-CoA reductase 1-like isoform X5 [Panicum hallii]|uniref:very-long-chain 3-oxoacyl-CoA reductase 1-like isoform X5 n=1 Tax=Panicum hallii TaxID=206008 RepID=UPI000DF4F01D|nr:very-long-chain 3-oxoacyl-CoA reductase 1-like isoform X5 [Panicum hallii]
MDIAADDLRQRCFLSLAVLGALYLAAVTLRLLDCLGLPSLLRRPTNLRRRYGAWAVVTGPTSGIGRSMALELARRGLSVVLIGRDPDRLCDISDAITRNHAVQTKTVVFDLSLVSTTQGDEAMRRLREAVEGLDVGVLVNNAGVAKPCAVYLHEFDVEAWMRMVRVNLWALTEVAAAVLPGMAARGRGAVVNIGSGSTEAIPSFPLYTVYAATKRYVAQFSRSLYVEYRSKGIDVQCQATSQACSLTNGHPQSSRPHLHSTARLAKQQVRTWRILQWCPTVCVQAIKANASLLVHTVHLLADLYHVLNSIKVKPQAG